MGYYTYKILKGITLERLHERLQANLALYEPGTVGRSLSTTLFEGHGCSALIFSQITEDQMLLPLGLQFGCVWMDVRYQDADSWDLSLYEGDKWRCNHSVNPWAHDGGSNFDQSAAEYRIELICGIWSDEAERIRRYLLPWREPVSRLGRTRFVRRTGKAYDADAANYCDADQIHDFLRAFGIERTSRMIYVGRD